MGKIFRPIVLHHGKLHAHVVAFVDSGADISVVSEKVADRLRIIPRTRGSIRLADGREIETRIGFVTVESPNDRIKHRFRVDITDVPFIEDIDKVDMIIGIDFLQMNGIRLDFREPIPKTRNAATA
jgi:predicted aspartyl protease